MRRVRSVETAPEIEFRKALRRTGLRFKTYPLNLPGKPDIVLPSRHLAIFIDGNFWHGGQWSRRKLAALEDQFQRTRSREYWLSKIRRNMQRDCSVTASLLSKGWTVLRFWESQVREALGVCVEATVRAAGSGAKSSPYSSLPQKTFCDFFAGIGLMRLGLERQGWSVAFSNDIDQQKYEMYRGNFPDAERHYLVRDIHEVNPRKVPTATLATASFPCNDLSLAGARDGLRGKQSSAFWGFVDVLEKLRTRRPPIVMLENVTGFLTSHNGADFRDALLALNRLGYAVDALVLDAASFTPQSRQRLFVIGVFDNGEDSGVPALVESGVRPRALAQFIFTHPEIRWNIRPVPAPHTNTPKLVDILEDLPDDAPEWWSEERAHYLLNQMSHKHKQVATEMIARRKWSYGTVFRRVRNEKSMAELRTDGIAGCLRTPRGGSGRQILFKAGYGKYAARLLTPRECARLMGADDYTITVPLNQALFGFGDAVCVPVIEWLAKHYLNPLIAELLRGRVLSLSA